MQGLMQHRPLVLSSLLEHAARYHPHTEIVSRTMTGGIHRLGYAELDGRARRLARALLVRGVKTGDRIATLAFNTHRHLEVQYAVSGIGAICHTINPRLFHEQIRYIIDHAEDTLLFVDPPLVPLARQVLAGQTTVRGVIVLGDRAETEAAEYPEAIAYEPLIDAEASDHEWEAFDELTACGLCYTSGTTGNPKGVLYSHRTTVLHTMAVQGRNGFDIHGGSTALALVPMFHANVSWGIPFAATMNGAKLVLPGPRLDGASLVELIVNEAVTTANGVPTIWQVIVDELIKIGQKPPALQRVVIAGSAPPPAMIQTLEQHFRVEVGHLWGMTETSPCGTSGTLHREAAALGYDELLKLKTKQGRGIWGVDLRVVDADGNELPRRADAYGDLRVRGLWVLGGYYRQESPESFDADGWFSTGDVASVDEDGYLHIADRAKDLIKSGGEWISSIEVENLAAAHPAVREAAVIGVPHPKWGERPVLVVVPREGADPEKGDLLRFLENKIARWWIPDDVIVVSQIPHSATGKVQKVELRRQLKDHPLAVEGLLR